MGRDDILQQTLAGLEEGLHVRHIATPNPRCWHDRNDVEAALTVPELRSFDQIPVQEADRIVGVIERNVVRLATEPLGYFRPLDDSLVVAAEEPLGRFMRYMTENPTREYQLVVSGNRIDAIVTRSDLLKLPVRVYAFALITHLESVMASVIRTVFSNRDQWEQHLSEERRERIQWKMSQATSDRIDPSPIEFTDFCDKRDVIRAHYKLQKGFKRDLERIERARDSIAHAGDYAETEEQLRKFLKSVDTTHHWIDELNNRLLGTTEGVSAL